jgi:hypothetical protein
VLIAAMRRCDSAPRRVSFSAIDGAARHKHHRRQHAGGRKPGNSASVHRRRANAFLSPRRVARRN